jgi:hypothetical protein
MNEGRCDPTIYYRNNDRKHEERDRAICERGK